MHVEPCVYSDGTTTFRGELVLPQASGRCPGVLIMPEGGGINPHPKQRARQLAERGYAALAVDLYGDGEYLSDPKRRSERMGELRRDPDRVRGRARLAFDALAGHHAIDPARLAVLGFCFGGMMALELARSGAPIVAAISFHGILATQRPASEGAIQGRILACHGAEDPFVPPDQVAAFESEMRAAGARWEAITYGGAKHGFTRRDAASLGMEGVAYDEHAERRSWLAMESLLEDVFR